MWVKLFTALMVFSGAFLSFSLEPIVGRLITPFFGGSAHLWTVSLMVFQALLLLAYLYAHLLAKRLGRWHLLVLLLPLLQWPLNFVSEVAPSAPTLTLIIQLFLQVSLPFAVLCTTAVVAQSWWYQSKHPATQTAPYFLYAVSNWGAMVALFAYPFVLEPLLGLAAQRWLWSFAYLAYAALTVGVWFVLNTPLNGSVNTSVNTSVSGLQNAPLNQAAPAYPVTVVLRWLALSAAPSALLLACTNVISMEVGAFPLVWVFPLALYLGAFTWAFSERANFLARIAQKYILEISLIALLCSRLLATYIGLIPVLLLAFFLLCLVAHRALYGLRPHPAQLTHYYLWIALGGWVGGLLVSLLAPVLFSGLWEYPLAVLSILLLCWPQAWLGWWKNAARYFAYARLGLLALCMVVLGLHLSGPPSIYSLRNFYGIHKINEKPAVGAALAHRQLLHGQTVHGMQHVEGKRGNEPLAYYYPGGAMAIAMETRSRSEPSAIVGLGAGSALAWFEAGEKVRVYEIDPDVEQIAKNWFRFFADSNAAVTVSLGDARLNFRSDQALGDYGAILVDAFSGDGIPVHLLTLEALDVYLSRLSPNGILVFHVSNRYYDLIPVLKAAAGARGLTVIANTPRAKTTYPLHIDPQVVVMARQDNRLTELLKRPEWRRLDERANSAKFEPWTDDHVSVLGALWSKYRKTGG